MEIFELLKLARARNASDLHLVAYVPPVMRIHGILTKAEEIPPMTEDEFQQGIAAMTTAENLERFRKTGELDFSFSMDGGRFRCNASRHLGTTALVIRVLPLKIPVIEDLGLPSICKDLINKPRGLIIISGPTGSGKSTTLAAMINHINRSTESRGRRIVTVEDPVEYVYQNENCLITQRELGSDTQSFSEALRHVLRQDPDIILIGEMRDPETAAAALTIAETGHLVLTTGHAPSSSGAIERVVDLFPPHERSLVQSRISTLLVGVLCQTLIPRVDKQGMTAAIEIMLANTAVRNVIRDGKIFQIPNIIRTNQQEGMQLLDHALIKLYRHKVISNQSLYAFCNDRDEIERLFGKNEVVPEQEPAVAVSVNRN
ncbi:MAG: PilT/PilU family type 4a pilus ATPase [Dehalococcoidales bacterium]|nr:PilT/PilU family type 4a pilus ATPase [Dehalococcoidales bacterium]